MALMSRQPNGNLHSPLQVYFCTASCLVVCWSFCVPEETYFMVFPAAPKAHQCWCLGGKRAFWHSTTFMCYLQKKTNVPGQCLRQAVCPVLVGKCVASKFFSQPLNSWSPRAEAGEAIYSFHVLKGSVSPPGTEGPSAMGYPGVAWRRWEWEELGALSPSACERKVWPSGWTELGSKDLGCRPGLANLGFLKQKEEMDFLTSCSLGNHFWKTM